MADFPDFGGQLLGGLSDFGSKIFDNAASENAKSNGGKGLFNPMSGAFGNDDKPAPSIPSASAPSAPSAPSPTDQPQAAAPATPQPPPPGVTPAPAVNGQGLNSTNWLANMQQHPMWQSIPPQIQQVIARLYQQHQGGGLTPPMPPNAQPGVVPRPLPFASRSPVPVPSAPGTLV